MADFSRRSLMRGILGGGAVCMGIPTLDLFLDGNGKAFADVSEQLNRFKGKKHETNIQETSGAAVIGNVLSSTQNIGSLRQIDTFPATRGLSQHDPQHT